jgi:DNA-binding LacI/PurR family transcriptional regulator
MTTARAHTIADIARLAGVSKSTVSRALNDSPLIGAETKERIRRIAREHRFAMNEPARRLSLRQSNVAGLVMFGAPGGDYTPDMFMLEIMGGISAGLNEHGYELLVIQPHEDEENWARSYVASGRADGFVVLSASCTPRRLKLLTQSEAPFVVWGRQSPTGAFSSVSGDNLTGGRRAAEHLLATGKQRILFLGGPDWAPEIVERRRGYEAALAEAGVELDPLLVAPLPWEQPEEDAAEVVERLLAEGVEIDGIAANSDRYAFGALEALRDRGLRVPEDVAVVGYDDVAIARLATPALTTIRQDGALAGRLLARTLVQQIQTGAITNVSMPAELVVREST